jgi:hypothetical protein
VDDALGDALGAAAQSSGEPVAPEVRERVEARTGADLSGVRVHDGPASDRAASAISARAYADGQHVHFAAGQYRPGTPDGDHLLAHELAHAIQAQSTGAGGGDAVRGKRELGDAGDAHEVEADAFADAVTRGGPAPSLGRSGGIGRKIRRDPAPAPKFTIVARVPPGVLLGDGIKDPITDALTREIWVSVALGGREVFYVSCPADGAPHFVDAKGAPAPTARSFGRAQYDLLIQDPQVQQVSGAGAAGQAEACAAAIRAAFDREDGQEILRQLNRGPETVRAAVRYYDTRLNTLGGQGLIADIQQRYPVLYEEAVVEMRTAGIALPDDIGSDLASDPTGASREHNAHNLLAAARIVADPASAFVVPGTSITYAVALPEMWSREGYTVHGAWSCLRDSSNNPATNTWDPFAGPQDALSWQMTWTEPGVQHLQVKIFGSWPEAPWNLGPWQDWRNDPRTVLLRYTQVVLPQQVAADAAFATSATADPMQQRAQLQKYLDYVAPPDQPVAPANADAVSAIKAQIASIDGLLGPTAGRQRTPIHAVHLAAGTGEVTPLQLLVVSPDAAPLATASTPARPAGPRTWQLLDVTKPGNDRWHGTGSGTADNDADAIRAAIADWQSRVQYPAGTVDLQVPASVAHQEIDVEFQSYGNPGADIAEFLQSVGGTVGAIGFIGALLCPPLGLAAFAAVFGAVAVAGAAMSGTGAALHALDTYYYRTGTAQSYAMDLLTIATSFFVVGGAVGEGAQILSKGQLRGFVVGGLATGSGQFLVMQAQYIEQAQHAMQIQDPKARLDALLSVLEDAVVNDGMTLIALSKGAEAYRQLGTLADPAVVQAELLDPAAQIETGTSIQDLVPESGATTDPAVPPPAAATGDAAGEPDSLLDTATADPELATGGQSQGHETTAAAVPGSDFHGGIVAQGNPDAVMTHARAAFESAAERFEGVKSVEHASSAEMPDRASYGDAAAKQIADTYVITMDDGSSFTVRITSGPLDTDAVARTVINTTKQGVTRVVRPGASGPVEVDVVGRYVIQLSDTIDPAVAERAIAHEIGEILAERKLASANQPVGQNLLDPLSKPGPGANLSPHDQGRIGEIKVLAQGVNAGDPTATREMLALVEQLGLRSGTDGANVRQQLVTLALGGDDAALQALGKTWMSDAQLAQLDPVLEAQRDAVRAGRQDYLDSAATKQAADQPLHDVPDASPDPGTIISPERAVELAVAAENARAARSVETIRALRAAAAGGETPVVKGVQIGGGASLAARDPNVLLIDARGRWQADPSALIAQTANQLAGLKAAGIGDPFQFAAPNDRVPVSAVRYWEDTIAAEGPVIDGTVTGVKLENGKTVIAIQPSDGSPPLQVAVEGKGNIVASTGFPDERIPGTPRVPSSPDRPLTTATPDWAIDRITGALEAIVDNDPAHRDAARSVLGQIEQNHLSGLETEPGKRTSDLAQVKQLIDGKSLWGAIESQMPDAAIYDAVTRMAAAGDQWNAATTAHPDRVMLGDMANLESMNPMATNNWVIGGLGGTGISAAEIIFDENPSAHVTMVGGGVPDGLMENDQFRAVVNAHADLATADALGKLFGTKVPTTSDGRFSIVFGVSVDSVAFDNGQVELGSGGKAIGVPAGYDDASNPLAGAGGFISAIGRDGQLPPVFAELADSVIAQGGKVTMQPMYDAQGRYTNYRLVAMDAGGNELQHFDVTGAASRFPPWELFDGTAVERQAAIEAFRRASDLDAPPESGNFDGGYVASAVEANRYAHRGEVQP